jgi:hypothetical protein
MKKDTLARFKGINTSKTPRAEARRTQRTRRKTEGAGGVCRNIAGAKSLSHLRNVRLIIRVKKLLIFMAPSHAGRAGL